MIVLLTQTFFPSQNERNTIVVPQLQNYTDCPILFPNNSRYEDSGYVRTKTVDEILDLENKALLQGKDTIGFCAVVGPKDAHAHAGLSVVTEHLGLPQLAYSTTNHLLSRDDLYPNFIRVIPDTADAAVSLALAAVGGIWNRTHIGTSIDKNKWIGNVSATTHAACFVSNCIRAGLWRAV